MSNLSIEAQARQLEKHYALSRVTSVTFTSVLKGSTSYNKDFLLNLCQWESKVRDQRINTDLKGFIYNILCF